MLSSLPSLSALQSTYIHLTTHIIPGPRSISYFLPLLILPTSLLFPSHILPKHILTWVVFPISLACTLHAMIAMRGADVISVDGIWWAWLWLVGRDVRKELGKVVEREGDGRLEVWKFPEKGTLWERGKWVGMLVAERPGTCWVDVIMDEGGEGKERRERREGMLQEKKPYIVQTRGKFVKDVLMILLPAVFFWMPLALQLRVYERFFPPWMGLGSQDNEHFIPFPLIFPERFSIPLLLHRHIPAFLLRPLTLGMYVYALLTLLFLPAYLLPVLISCLINPSSGAKHTWSPHLWPRPHFGPFSAVLDEGLRGLWGKWWHQQMRHAVSEPGRSLARKLGLRRGGLPRYAMICASAFLLSGLTHMGLVPPEPLGADGKGAWELRGRIGGFFWVQPVGILVEVVVVERALSAVRAVAGPSSQAKVMIRILRVAWVLLFLSFALRFLIVPFEELGFWKIWPPFFFGDRTKGLLAGRWLA